MKRYYIICCCGNGSPLQECTNWGCKSHDHLVMERDAKADKAAAVAAKDKEIEALKSSVTRVE